MKLLGVGTKVGKTVYIENEAYAYVDFGAFNFKLRRSDGKIIVMWNKFNTEYPTREI